MLRAMILIVLGILLLITIITQVVMPMFIDQLRFFWYFRKGSRDDIIIPEKDDEADIHQQAHKASKEYKSAKNVIKQQIKTLKKLDRETDV